VTDTFPRQYARTQRFTLGAPRNLTIVADDSAVLFLRSSSGSDAINRLWRLDLATGIETLLADPAALLATDTDDLPPEERARRERMREGAGGITDYATDCTGATAVFALAGRLFVTDVAAAATAELAVPGPVFDPRPSPDGSRIAYVRGPQLHVVDRAGAVVAVIGEPDADSVAWGSADFVAAEEMHRFRGYWWSPASDAIAVCRVDEADVTVWHIGDPANPAGEPRSVRYPAAGTANPAVSLHIVQLDRPDSPVAVTTPALDGSEWPYLASVSWTGAGLVGVSQTRDQRRTSAWRVDPTTGQTTEVFADHDTHWVELVPGSGVLVGEAGGSTFVTCADRDGARRLVVGGAPVSPADLQVRAIVDAAGDRVIVVGNPLDDPTVAHVYRWSPGAWQQLTTGDGVHAAVAGRQLVLTDRATLDAPGSSWHLPDGSTVASHAETPLVEPNVTLLRTPGDALAVAVLLPAGRSAGDGGPALPVLLDPYGGPHAQRVVQSYNAHCTSQWFAEQGFAVVVVDGRGTPGRGPKFERDVYHDLADGVLADQIDGLAHAADATGVFDLDRVAIRGWSFGGYLAALAVMRRPDVFHAAIAGAPVTEWRLYDTHYTERYLGDPRTHAGVYEANSLLPLAGELTRPLLLIHGLADDNVVAAHTLQLSSALLAAGRPHEVLPLVGVTHMTPQEVVAENLLRHQLEFLRRQLGAGSPDRRAPARVPLANDSIDDLNREIVSGAARVYRGVAVAANTNEEHAAALELLALVVAADARLEAIELDAIRAITDDWRDGDVALDRYLTPALAKAQAAVDSGSAVALIDEIDGRINSRVLRRALFSAAREVAGVDDDVSPEEGSLLAEIAVRFG
jgi:dipeptidyl-peptidase-4